MSRERIPGIDATLTRIAAVRPAAVGDATVRAAAAPPPRPAVNPAATQTAPEPAPQRASLPQSLRHALLAEVTSRGERAPAPPLGAVAARYAAAANPSGPTLERAFAALVERQGRAGPGPRAALVELWAALEAPVRAAFGATPEVDHALAVLREQVLQAVVVAQPSLPARAPVGPQGAPVEPAAAGASSAPATASASSVSLSTPPATDDDPAPLVRLPSSPESVPAAPREPGLSQRWFAELPPALARGPDLPQRPAQVAPRRRLAAHRGRAPAADEADERVLAIGSSDRDAWQPDDEREPPPDDPTAPR